MAKLAAVVLAAGGSTRFGAENKLLARLDDGRAIVRCVADTLIESGIPDIVVVTGCDAAAIEAALSGLPVRFAANAAWESGMGASIAAGVRALDDDIGGAFIVPGDMPLLTPTLIGKLANTFTEHGWQSIVYPAMPDGAQRNPVLWPRRFFAQLAALSGPKGAKTILEGLKDHAVAVEADDSDQLADVDTAADLEAAKLRSMRGGDN